jgi:peptidyl-prolyl cis-trans isomerase B (cyclophilin B)
MSTEDRSNTTKKSTVYVALITALAIIIGSVILGIGGQTPKTVITFKTNLGEIVISTKSDEAPQTVAAISKLAQENYFDNTICHRLTTEGIFVLQCGDPTGTGTGGPGFNIPDENLPEAVENNYPAGTVAMANAGPGTSGSQFFLVYQDTTLPNAAYTIWGSITSGLDILKTIASAGVVGGGADGAPVTGVTIESTKVTIS